MLLTGCMGCAESKPQDLEYPRLKPVGVYPVEKGWAHINLEEVAGKGRDHKSPLYVVPGDPLSIHRFAYLKTSSTSCRTRVSWLSILPLA